MWLTFLYSLTKSRIVLFFRRWWLSGDLYEIEWIKVGADWRWPTLSSVTNAFGKCDFIENPSDRKMSGKKRTHFLACHQSLFHFKFKCIFQCCCIWLIRSYLIRNIAILSENNSIFSMLKFAIRSSIYRIHQITNIVFIWKCQRN